MTRLESAQPFLEDPDRFEHFPVLAAYGTPLCPME